MSTDPSSRALTIPEREAILSAIDDVPAGFEELHGVLLREVAARGRAVASGRSACYL